MSDLYPNQIIHIVFEFYEYIKILHIKSLAFFISLE